MSDKVAAMPNVNNAGETASEQWNRSFLRQSHLEFAFMLGVAILVTFVGPWDETWRYVAAGIVMLGVIVGYFTAGVKSFKGYGRRGRRGALSDRLAPGITLAVHRRRVMVHLGTTVIAAGLIAWIFPHKMLAYLLLAVMTMVDAWHLLPRRRDIWRVLLVLIVSLSAGLLLTTGGSLGRNEWLTALIAAVISAVGASFTVWLEVRNARETEKYVRLADELKAAQSVIASQQHAAGVFAERERMAGEIHDTLAQGFLAIVTQAQVAAAAIGRNDDAARSRLAVIEQVARENLAEARGLVAATAPVPLHDAGLIEALHNLGSRFSTETGIAVTVNTPDDGAAVNLPPADEVVLIRAAQEALNNTRKHSKATAATIILSSVEEAQSGVSKPRTVLEITDDGIGIPSDYSEGFGLTGMRDRVESVGGTMAIIPSVAEPNGVSKPRGTTIRIELPNRG
jgi:signal transduction histidine kinase